MSAPLRIIFMGTPAFVVPVLDALVQSEHEVLCAYTQPPRPAGRGRGLTPSPVHTYADTHGIAVRHPKSLRSAEAQADFAALKPDLAVVAGYGLLLPKAVLDCPKHGCINIHTSLLPRWRGAAPVQYAIWQGDAQTGTTIMQMDTGMDTGDMIRQIPYTIQPTDTAADLYDTLFKLGADALPAILADIDNIKAEKQDDALATPAPMLAKTDGLINWQQTAQQIDQQIRAFTPWPGTYTFNAGRRLKIISASPSATTTKAAPGTLLDKQGHAACAQGTLKLERIQLGGTKPMDITAALNGNHIKIGDILG